MKLKKKKSSATQARLWVSEAAVEASDTSSEMHAQWWPLAVFCLHIVIGSLIFVVVFLPVLLLDWILPILVSHGVGTGPVVMIRVCQWTLVVSDGLLYIIFLFKSAYRAIRNVRCTTSASTLHEKRELVKEAAKNYFWMRQPAAV